MGPPMTSSVLGAGIGPKLGASIYTCIVLCVRRLRQLPEFLTYTDKFVMIFHNTQSTSQIKDSKSSFTV